MGYGIWRRTLYIGVNEGETGLDIFIVGSMLSDNYANWKNEFIAALLSKFHVAIARDEFVAIVDGKEINSKSMKEIFVDHETIEVDDKQALKEAKWLFELDNPREICYYICVNEERLEKEAGLHKQIVDKLKSKPRNAFRKISYGISNNFSASSKTLFY